MSRPWAWQLIKEEIKKRDNNHCVRCGCEGKQRQKYYDFVEWKSNLVVDHIVPLKLGGEMLNGNNLQTLCFRCNKEKNKWDQHFIAKQKRINKRDKI